MKECYTNCECILFIYMDKLKVINGKKLTKDSIVPKKCVIKVLIQYAVYEVTAKLSGETL